MQYRNPAAIAILLCAVANPAWSGVPHTQQRTPAQATILPARDECMRIASVENDIASLKSSIEEMMKQLQTLNAAGKNAANK